MVIRALVWADSKQSAFDKATKAFEALCENQHPFDYFQTFETAGTPVSGAGRWGEMPAVSLVSSKAGKKLVEDGMKYTKDETFEALDYLRSGLLASNEEIWKHMSNWREMKPEERSRFDYTMLRYRGHCLGQYSGSSFWLYDEDGSAIRDDGDLNAVLSGRYLGEGEKERLKLYVIPADVHF